MLTRKEHKLLGKIQDKMGGGVIPHVKIALGLQEAYKAGKEEMRRLLTESLGLHTIDHRGNKHPLKDETKHSRPVYGSE